MSCFGKYYIPAIIWLIFLCPCSLTKLLGQSKKYDSSVCFGRKYIPDSRHFGLISLGINSHHLSLVFSLEASIEAQKATPMSSFGFLLTFSFPPFLSYLCLLIFFRKDLRYPFGTAIFQSTTLMLCFGRYFIPA